MEVDLLTTYEAAESLRLKPETLTAWRTRGGGPKFVRLGRRVLYRRTDLDAFIVARVHSNTATPAEGRS